jgi:hypothetical protein
VKNPESGIAGELLVGVEKQVEGATGELWKIENLPEPFKRMLKSAS